MKALYFEQFAGPITLQTLPDPVPDTDGVVIDVKATGLCRSDWHGWKGHDPDIVLPHVPGHELAGEVVAVGVDVNNWQVGDRVTLPFVCGCGRCPQCLSGNQQVCDAQFQPGFTAWGSFAEYVAIKYADANLVRLPEDMAYETAASLGCRFVTSFRAVVEQGRLRPGQWLVVHGCGGVGLSAIMIANALGARVIGVDIDQEKMDLAHLMGAEVTINGSAIKDVVSTVKSLSGGGAHVSIDALGSQETCFNSISNLRKRGRHIQVGLMTGSHQHPRIPMEKVIANELEILGSHGMQAHAYGRLLGMIESGKLQPQRLIGKRISLQEGAQALQEMDAFHTAGIAVITEF